MIVKHYQNKRNKNKYIEVRHYTDGHYGARQYMLLNNGVKNYIGSRKGKLFRWRKKNIESLLEDYVEVERD